jgi:GTP1/Obg family GTP-binding protein
MNAEDKRKLIGTMSLIDQALAPLTNAHKIIEEVVDKENGELDEVEDPETDKNLERRDKIDPIAELVEKLSDILEELHKAKDEIEAY